MNSKNRLILILVLALAVPIIAMVILSHNKAEEVAATPVRPEGPCDIYADGGTPCVTAHSTTRALSASYNGPLYQVTRQSDGETFDVGIVPPSAGDAGGYADAAAQDAFCNETTCFISIIYDQSGHGNDLLQAPPGTFVGPAKGGFNTLPIADMAPISIGGHKAYGVYVMPGMGLRNNDAVGLAINDEPQGIYMVFDGTHYDNGCCFNYGNTSTSSDAVGRGTMDTVYFGTSTAWGSGEGSGPWIMSDMEAGLFSGYDAKQNIGSPTIDSWRFVTGMVNGGGGNQWEIRGADAQAGELATFYKGVRPGSNENDLYFPMHRKGAVQMGNGGDNGNGSAGTFYEGVVTFGYPTEEAVHAVQANIVAAGYDVHPVNLSRITTFTPGSSQEVTMTFRNSAKKPITVDLSLVLPEGWHAVVDGSDDSSKTFTAVEPDTNVGATFTVTSPKTPGGGFLSGKAAMIGRAPFKTAAQRVRNVEPVKINEVAVNPTDSFVELYNASDEAVDLSNWTLINTRSEWAPVTLATIPEGTQLAAKSFYVLGLADSGLSAPASAGDTTVHVRTTSGLEVGQQIDIGGETRTITAIGTPASTMTTLFIPRSTGPWLSFPAGTDNLPVTSATGFEVGQKIGIDIGGNDEVATVTKVGTAATQTTLSGAVKAGATTIKVADNSKMSVGDTLTIGTGGRKETATIKSIILVSAAPPGGRRGTVGTPGEIELTAPLKNDQIDGVDVSDTGTGICFTPATRFAHKSGDAIQALGSGLTLDQALAENHAYGTPVVYSADALNFKGAEAPNQWFGEPLSDSAGSIALMSADGQVVVDAMVYGSQQSNSSGNGTITSPELATLEGEQSQGGCIVVVPRSGRDGFGRRNAPTTGAVSKSMGRFPDGADTDSNCTDFLVQTNDSAPTPGAPNQYVREAR